MALGEIIGGQALGLMLGGYNDDRQRRQQEALTDIQVRGQKDMANYNRELAMKTWEETNYDAQKKQMEKAGLNVGLMYGGGGAGGGTVNSGGGGSVGSGTADGGTARTAMGMQLASQIALLDAQKRNVDADTANKLAGAGKDKALADNTNVDTEGKTIDVNIKKNTQDDAEKKITFDAEKAFHQAKREATGAEVDLQTQQAEITKRRNEAIGSGIDNEVAKLGMNLDRRKVNAIEESVRIAWEKLMLEKREVTVKELAQAAQESYMRNSNIKRGEELDQRQWEAISNATIGAVGMAIRK
jgi:hypothetical protein